MNESLGGMVNGQNYLAKSYFQLFIPKANFHAIFPENTLFKPPL